MNKPRTVLVTGASGKLGQRVVEMLMYEGTGRVIAATRTPAKIAHLARRGVEVRHVSFDDPKTLERAFGGAERIALINTETTRSALQHENAIRAAEHVGATHVVFTSHWHASTSEVADAKAARATEIALAQSALTSTILRNNMYADTVFDLLDVPRAVANGEIVSVVGDAGITMVTRDDSARAIVAALTSDDTKSRTLEIGGPSEVRVHHLAILLSALAGSPVRHRSVSPEGLRKHLAMQAMSPADADHVIQAQLAMASGAYAGDSDDFAALTGRVPTSLVGFLMFHADDAREWAKGAGTWRRVS